MLLTSLGRKGQDRYCLLFSHTNSLISGDVNERLQKFCQEKDGLKLAQMDLENRGAGDIFGYKQSGLNDLQFASWTNSQIISKAQEELKNNPNYQSFLKDYLEKSNLPKMIEAATN